MVKVIDEYRGESPWSDPFDVEIIDEIEPNVEITKPEKGLYINNKKILPRFLESVLIICDIEIEVDAYDEQTYIEKVEFYINEELMETDIGWPYRYEWKRDRIRLFHSFLIKVVAYDLAGNTASDIMEVRKIL